MPDDKVAKAVEALRQAMIETGEDPGQVEAKLRAAIPNETNLVGNYADLQRLGGQQASESGGIADAFVMPEGGVEAEVSAAAAPAKSSTAKKSD